MNNWIKEGYEEATKNAGTQYGGQMADQYVSRVNEAIDKLNDDLNAFEGFKTGDGQLQGNVAEYWHGDSFNINAVINESSDRANVPGSHGLGSADIKVGDIEYGLKYYKDAIASAKAQSESYFQRFFKRVYFTNFISVFVY